MLAPPGSDSISPRLEQPWKIARLLQPLKYFTKGWIIAPGAPWLRLTHRLLSSQGLIWSPR